MLRFGAVGIVGFIVDAGALVALVKLVGLSPLAARVTSFLIAASVTFVLNQRITFQLNERFSVSRWANYILTTAAGAGINIGVYHLWLSYVGSGSIDLVGGTAAGSITAMFVNYFASSLLVFRTVNQRPMT
jgi:putative flippase GtrA